jgi:hypothetical protein
MTVAKLQDLKRQVEAAIHAKVEERRREIEAELSKLAHFNTERTNGVTAHVKRKVAVRAGKRLDEDNSRKVSTPKRPSKPQKVKKKARKSEIIEGPQPLMLADTQPTEVVSIEPRSAAPTSANDVPIDLGAAA